MKQSTAERIASKPGGLKSALEGRNAKIERLRAVLHRIENDVETLDDAKALAYEALHH